MKILEVNNFQYVRGGSDVMYLNTSKLLREAGHDVIEFSQESSTNEQSDFSKYFPKYLNFAEAGITEKMRLMSNFFFSSQASKNLKKLIRDHKPDIAHLHIFYGGLTSSILPVLKDNNIPIVVTLHEYKLLCPVYTLLDNKGLVCEKCCNGNSMHAITNKCSKGSLPNSIIIAAETLYRDFFFNPKNYFDRIICVSQFSKKIHVTHRPELTSKLEHIYNFSNDLENEPYHYKEGKYLLYFGRLSREKGIATLLKAFIKTSGLTLKIVGSGPLKEEIEEFIMTNPTSSIQLIGFKKGNELYEIIKNASFVIVPSEWYENNPMTIIESYFLGKPVIGADIGGISEIINNGETGFLFSPGNVDSLREVLLKTSALSDNSLKKLSVSSRNFAEKNFGKISHYEKLMNVFNSCLRQKK